MLAIDCAQYGDTHFLLGTALVPCHETGIGALGDTHFQFRALVAGPMLAIDRSCPAGSSEIGPAGNGG